MDKLLGRTRRRLSGGVPLAAAMIGSAALIPLVGAKAVTFSTMNGAPVQMQPYVDEPGAPTITVPVGTSQPFGGLGGSGAAGGGGSGGDGSPAGSSEALTTMLATAWGGDAASASQIVGINPSVLAATCVVESGCKDVAGTGTVSGAFQMTDGTYTQDMNKLIAQNPSLAGIVDTSLAGKRDPANQAYGAAQDLKSAALTLQSAGIANPTATDVRAYYQWGAGAGPQVALAPSDAKMSDILSSYYTAAQLRENAVSPTTTVGEWRSAFASKVGSAATQQVLLN